MRKRNVRVAMKYSDRMTRIDQARREKDWNGGQWRRRSCRRGREMNDGDRGMVYAIECPRINVYRIPVEVRRCRRERVADLASHRLFQIDVRREMLLPGMQGGALGFQIAALVLQHLELRNETVPKFFHGLLEDGTKFL